MCPRHVFVVSLLVMGVSSLSLLQEEADRDLRQLGGDFNPSYSVGSQANAAAAFKTKSCSERPRIPSSAVQCASSGCRVRCKSGYKTQAGQGSAMLVCDKKTGLLMADNQPWTLDVLSCKPYCGQGGCFNGGTCVAPRQCQCPSGFTGPQCQEEEDTCPEPQIQLGPASASWSPTVLEVECNPGYTFPIGGSHATIHCRGGEWDMTPGIFTTGGVLLCQAQCVPACQNGGTCIQHGVCDCPTGFWGPLCQLQRCTYPRRGLAHASLGGNLSRMKIECHEDYQLLSGRRALTVLCRGGEWTIPRKGLMKDNDVKCYPKDELEEKARPAYSLG